MSQAAAQQPSRKKTVISLLVLLALTCIIVFTFKDHWAEITTALAQLSVWQVLDNAGALNIKLDGADAVRMKWDVDAIS